ncbi:transposable element Tcb1 transposase [Trichonephila clavipes]|nr:transposable element Tcb1 transposase [Trichonephila clavipes]
MCCTNQATVMRICHFWMQEETDQRGRSLSSRCTTVRDEKRIVHMAVMDRAATSRIIAQQIQSVTHHSMSARTIRRRLQQSGMSAKRSVLCLSLSEKPQAFAPPFDQ